MADSTNNTPDVLVVDGKEFGQILRPMSESAREWFSKSYYQPEYVFGFTQNVLAELKAAGLSVQDSKADG